MSIDEFTASLTGAEPPVTVPLALQALWWDGKGDWKAAHDTLQNDNSADGSWVHAYLHRKEGDASNASYWYRRAGKPAIKVPLDAEWRTITTTLLQAAGDSPAEKTVSRGSSGR